jgi:hypothetical protein
VATLVSSPFSLTASVHVLAGEWRVIRSISVGTGAFGASAAAQGRPPSAAPDPATIGRGPAPSWRGQWPRTPPVSAWTGAPPPDRRRLASMPQGIGGHLHRIACCPGVMSMPGKVYNAEQAKISLRQLLAWCPTRCPPPNGTRRAVTSRLTTRCISWSRTKVITERLWRSSKSSAVTRRPFTTASSSAGPSTSERWRRTGRTLISTGGGSTHWSRQRETAPPVLSVLDNSCRQSKIIPRGTGV